MQPRHVDLRGLTLAEAETKVRKLIDDVQDETLENYKIMLVDLGADPDELAVELARQRAEHVQWREHAIEKMHGMVECDGQILN